MKDYLDLVGLVPLVLAFFGFLFLVAIVNYNTLLRLQQHLLETVDTIVALSERKNNCFLHLIEAIKAHPNLDEALCNTIVSLGDGINKAQDNTQKILLAGKFTQLQQAVEGWAAQQNDIQELPAYQDFQAEINRVGDELRTQTKRFNQLSFDYNRMRTTAPSKYIARFFKFEAI
ncbi:LemA family protein [Eisenibacter elegans]|uniref:LemA family protein n=1 Tax=Eisenibacter elegans TaxID=997 RepID=UPI000423702C|nr:LemA family protein [Eisenibacter elegans]